MCSINYVIEIIIVKIVENLVKYIFKDKTQNKDIVAIILECKFFRVSPKNYSYFFEFLCSNFENMSKTLYLCYLLRSTEGIFRFLYDFLHISYRLFAQKVGKSCMNNRTNKNRKILSVDNIDTRFWTYSQNLITKSKKNRRIVFL